MKTTPADIVLRVLDRRKGFDYWWHDIDSGVQEDIKKALNKELIFQFPGIESGLVTNQKTEKP